MVDRDPLLLDNINRLFDGRLRFLQPVQPQIGTGKLVLYFGNFFDLAGLFPQRICTFQ